MSTLDDKVMQLMNEVERKKEKLGKLKKPQWTTSCSVPAPSWITDNKRFNIQVCTDLSMLALLRGWLNDMTQHFTSAMKAWQQGVPHKFSGYEIQDWISDIDLRVEILSMKTEQEKLKKLEAKLKTLTSEEQRRQMAIAEIEAELDS